MDRGAWWATVHEVAKSQTRLSTYTHIHTHDARTRTHTHTVPDGARWREKFTAKVVKSTFGL